VRFFRILLFILFCAKTIPVFAVGFDFTYPIIASDPDDLKGFRTAMTYQPKSLAWGRSHLYFNGSFGHWWRTEASNNHHVNIVALAPVFRYYFANTTTISPFGEISVGPAYLSRTRLGTYNLGMHFAFQDILGLGFTVGAKKHFSFTLMAMHYSNGSLCNHNRGMSLPLALNLGYRF